MNGVKKILTQRRGDSEIYSVPLCLCVLFVFLFFFSCSKKEEKIPAGIISKEKMVQLLVDYHLAEAQTQFHSTTDDAKTLKQSYYKFIFAKHKTDYNKLKKSFDFYSSHPEIFSKIYDDVITELSKKQAEASKVTK